MRRLAVVVSSKSMHALQERLALLAEVAPTHHLLVSGARGVDVEPGHVAYLLDVNGATAATALRLRGRPYVVDTGDDVAQLARNLGKGRPQVAARRGAERLLIRGAAAVVCRGTFHRPVLRSWYRGPLCWAPDTVDDKILDGPAASKHDDLIASFGTAGAAGPDGRTYGWEVIDVLARRPHLRGQLVVAGPGRAALERRADELGVTDRVSIEPRVPLAELLSRISRAAYITSVQSDDRAGWVRTTGKLPLALGVGAALLSTEVGEAASVLPARFLVPPGSSEAVADALAAATDAPLPDGWSANARLLAERYRRSSVSGRLRDFLRATVETG